MMQGPTYYQQAPQFYQQHTHNNRGRVPPHPNFNSAPRQYEATNHAMPGGAGDGPPPLESISSTSAKRSPQSKITSSAGGDGPPPLELISSKPTGEKSGGSQANVALTNRDDGPPPLVPADAGLNKNSSNSDNQTQNKLDNQPAPAQSNLSDEQFLNYRLHGLLLKR